MLCVSRRNCKYQEILVSGQANINLTFIKNLSEARIFLMSDIFLKEQNQQENFNI